MGDPVDPPAIVEKLHPSPGAQAPTALSSRGAASDRAPGTAIGAKRRFSWSPARTHSRPHTSDDNPYIEAVFKTLKYCPAWPGHFGSLQDARSWCDQFVSYYRREHGVEAPPDDLMKAFDEVLDDLHQQG